jgi:hypothetical protein
MQRARGYDEGTSICEFPFLMEKSWLEFLSFMHGMGGDSSSFAIDTEANADVIRLDYGRNDFAVIIRIIDLAPGAVVDHLFKKTRYGASFGLRNFRDVYAHAMGDGLNLTPETARFMRERLQYNFQPKQMLKERQEEEFETEEGWLRMHQRQQSTHSANSSSSSSNKRRGNFDGDGDDEMMMVVDRDSCCGGQWSQNKRPNY